MILSCKISKDIAKITTASSLDIDKIFNLIPNIASHYVLNNFNNSKKETVLDVGIGNLTIMVDEKSIRYSFTPSKSFSSCIDETISKNKDYLADILEERITSKLLNVYKDMI